jgi:uncharacterized protein YbjT (DUF2867 family)
VRLSHALIQPMAADDVASAVADAALEAPKNAIVETAGPEIFPLDELVGKVLAYDKDPRKIVVDPEALYYWLDQAERPHAPPRAYRAAWLDQARLVAQPRATTREE